MDRQGRRDYLRTVHGRYRETRSRAVRTQILNEFCEVAGYNRKYALGLLNGPPPERVVKKKRRPRRPIYGPGVISILGKIWEAAGYPWSVRLKALLPLWMPRARKLFGLSPRLEKQILAISPRQLDRRLRDQKQTIKKRIYGRTKPGTLLKHHIPIKTDHWKVTMPGFSEIDLVSHSGSNASGEFLHSLNLTDIHTTWVETRAVMGKSQAFVRSALEEIRRDLPFDLKGIDSDNGSEFINDHLFRYCRKEGIQFTRGRPYKKDDNAHVEQKNWTHVRKLLGYVRYDSQQALDAINALYANELRLFQNLFQPSVKLLRKERIGSKTRRRYDRARTPLERVMECPDADPKAVARLKALRDRIDPFALSRSIDRQLENIFALSSRRIGPAMPLRPFVDSKAKHPRRLSSPPSRTRALILHAP
jgi:hypothetical protein